MARLLRAFLVLKLLTDSITVFASLSSNPTALVIALSVNLLIWFVLWKMLDYVLDNNDISWKKTLTRIIVAVYFSVTVVAIGVSIGFIIRFFIDHYYSSQYPNIDQTSFLYRHFGQLSATVGFVLALPLMYIINRALKFKKSLLTAVAIFGGWYMSMFYLPR